jgi:hypothetical protein
MGALARRVAQLEQHDEGAGVWGVRAISHWTGTGPDVVNVWPTGEVMTEAAFRRRFPRGQLIYRARFTDRPDESGAGGAN